MKHRSLFLSLDGIDGTGKSTQCRLLADWLRDQGRDVVLAIDPGGTPLGKELREILLSHRRELTRSCEALLFMASRAQLVAEVIRPALDAGKVVISDRFLLANVVYQGHAGGLDVDLLWQAGRLSTGGLQPDHVYLLDLPLEVALARRGRPADRMESQPTEYHQRVRDGFLAEARRAPDRISVIDAGPAVDEVQAVLHREVAKLLHEEERA
jgi:dTMP kinase